jgi:hypothetical protein
MFNTMCRDNNVIGVSRKLLIPRECQPPNCNADSVTNNMKRCVEISTKSSQYADRFPVLRFLYAQLVRRSVNTRPA